MKSHIHIVALGIFCIIAVSCNDSTSIITENGQNTFRVTIAVKDTAGQPVPGLRISEWSRFNGIVLAKQANIDHQYSTLAVTSVRFDLPHRARITLRVLEADNAFVQTVIDSHWLEAGYYSANISIDTLLPTRVYKCRMMAEDSANSVLYKDSIFMVLWQPDPAISILGWSSANGMFETHDTLMFPNALSLPPLIYTTSESPDSVTTFSISDSVVVVLSDTAHHTFQTFYRTVRKGLANSLSLTWSPSSAKTEFPSMTRPGMKHDHVFDLVPEPGHVPTEFKLHQNFPNPFN